MQTRHDECNRQSEKMCRKLTIENGLGGSFENDVLYLRTRGIYSYKTLYIFYFENFEGRGSKNLNFLIDVIYDQPHKM